jgi:hypothetical protein
MTAGYVVAVVVLVNIYSFLSVCLFIIIFFFFYFFSPPPARCVRVVFRFLFSCAAAASRKTRGPSAFLRLAREIYSAKRTHIEKSIHNTPIECCCAKEKYRRLLQFFDHRNNPRKKRHKTKKTQKKFKPEKMRKRFRTVSREAPAPYNSPYAR